jgi:hypothetical protein
MKIYIVFGGYLFPQIVALFKNRKDAEDKTKEIDYSYIEEHNLIE